MNAQDLETPLAIRQHYNELQEAHDAGYANGNEHGVHMTIEESWEKFIGDYGKKEMAQPVPFFESQLHELCVALGWQGGTYHLVLAEVKRLNAENQILEAENTKYLNTAISVHEPYLLALLDIRDIKAENKRLRDALIWLKENRSPDRAMIETFIDHTLSPANQPTDSREPSHC